VEKLEILFDFEANNVAWVQLALTKFDSAIPELLEDADALFDTFLRSFSQGANQDENQRELHSAVLQLQVPGDAVAAVLPQPAPLEPSRAAAWERGRAAWANGMSLRVRGHLLLLSSRCYMFALSDLLRLRLTPVYGHMRLAAEAAVLACLIREQSALSLEWMGAISDEAGHRFHRAHGRSLARITSECGLDDAYQIGSGKAMHPRLGSISMGLAAEVREERGRRVEEYSLAFHEATPENPREMYLTMVHLVLTQVKVFAALARALPEASDEILRQQRLPAFGVEAARVCRRIFYSLRTGPTGPGNL